MAQNVRINVQAFGSAVDALGWRLRPYELPPGATLAALIADLERHCPRLAEAHGRVRFAVNLQYAGPDTALNPGDEVAVIPPVSGGAVPAARLVREPVDVAALLREVESPTVGGVACFVGRVRFETSPLGEVLRGLEYSAHEAMALAEMGRQCLHAVEQFELYKAVAVHRLGVLPIGEVAVAVACAAAHRSAALRACEWLIEAIKASVPIFKKDLWLAGRSAWHDPI